MSTIVLLSTLMSVGEEESVDQEKKEVCLIVLNVHL